MQHATCNRLGTLSYARLTPGEGIALIRWTHDVVATLNQRHWMQRRVSSGVYIHSLTRAMHPVFVNVLTD